MLSGQSFMYLHYADMIANGYIRTMPCPFQSQGLLLNPDGKLFYCENSKELGNVLDEDAEAIYFKAANLEHREAIKNDVCPTCLSPCQVNVGAMKQFVPYAKFLMRAYRVKRDPARHLETLPTTSGDRAAPAASSGFSSPRSSRPISSGGAIRPRSLRAAAGADPSWILLAVLLVAPRPRRSWPIAGSRCSASSRAGARRSDA